MPPTDAPIIDRPDTNTSLDETFRELTGYEEQLDDGSEKDRFGHYASKEDIVRATVESVAIVALCGKKWRPQRNPEKYPVCPACSEIYERMQPGQED